MSSKLDRWKKIAGSIPTSSIENSNKDQLIDELATVPVHKELEPIHVQEHIQNQDNIENQEEINTEYNEGVKSRSINQEYTLYSDSKSMNNTFVQKVSQDVSSFIEGRITQGQTHKKTSIMLRNDLRMKIANFDAANGGRAKGLLLNFLLDDFFAELEASDPKWDKILNRKIPNFK